MPLRKMEQGGKRDVEDGTGAVERAGERLISDEGLIYEYIKKSRYYR